VRYGVDLQAPNGGGHRHVGQLSTIARARENEVVEPALRPCEEKRASLDGKPAARTTTVEPAWAAAPVAVLLVAGAGAGVWWVAELGRFWA
jgi:hypothetical protein